MGAAALLAGATLVAGAGSGMASTHQRDGGSSPGESGRSQGSANGHSGHSSSGDSNSGDVWLDNSGEPAGPGHEQDSHLACADITLYGAHLADPNGTFTIDSWPPSGSRQQVYTSTWTYNTSAGGTQPIATISVTQLVHNAVASGATPVNKNGFHFKLDFSQDPQKHKTFWVSCPAGSGTAAGGPGPVSSPPPTEVPAPAPTPAPGTAGSPAGATTAAGASPAATQSVGAGATGGVEGLTTTTPAASAAPSAPGGVLGLSTGVPATGAGIAAGLAAVLIAIGLVAITASRRRTARL